MSVLPLNLFAIPMPTIMETVDSKVIKANNKTQLDQNKIQDTTQSYNQVSLQGQKQCSNLQGRFKKIRFTRNFIKTSVNYNIILFIKCAVLRFNYMAKLCSIFSLLEVYLIMPWLDKWNFETLQNIICKKRFQCNKNCLFCQL